LEDSSVSLIPRIVVTPDASLLHDLKTLQQVFTKLNWPTWNQRVSLEWTERLLARDVYDREYYADLKELRAALSHARFSNHVRIRKNIDQHLDRWKAAVPDGIQP
jgi:hypothetical protein